MNNTEKCIRLQCSSRQSGAALIISLILLVIMTLLGLAGIRGVTQQERMANHTVDRSIAFQATEAALRDIEALIEANNANVIDLTATPAVEITYKCNMTSDLRICDARAATDVARWLVDEPDPDFWKSLPAVGTGNLAVTPQYFVEFLGKNFECQPGSTSSTTECKRYRITARSNDGTGTNARSSVMLQSIYATD